MEVGCAVSRARDIAWCALRETEVSKGAVRTETAIVSVVWLVVSEMSVLVLQYRGIDEVGTSALARKLPWLAGASRDH